MVVREEMLLTHQLRQSIPHERERMEAWFDHHATPSLWDWDTEKVKPFPSSYGYSVIPNWAWGAQN